MTIVPLPDWAAPPHGAGWYVQSHAQTDVVWVNPAGDVVGQNPWGYWRPGEAVPAPRVFSSPLLSSVSDASPVQEAKARRAIPAALYGAAGGAFTVLAIEVTRHVR